MIRGFNLEELRLFECLRYTKHVVFAVLARSLFLFFVFVYILSMHLCVYVICNAE